MDDSLSHAARPDPLLRASGHNGAMSTQRISDKVAAQLRGLVQEQRLQPGLRTPLAKPCMCA